MTQPPGSGSLVTQFTELKKQFNELSRKAPAVPACRVQLSANQNLASGDTIAGTAWTAAEDQYEMWTKANPGYITVKLDGYYSVQLHCAGNGASAGQMMACKVQRNSTAVTNSIATDICGFPTGLEGAVCDAFRLRVKLAAGDRLYWSTYFSTAATLLASSFGVPTEMTLEYTSAR